MEFLQFTFIFAQLYFPSILSAKGDNGLNSVTSLKLSRALFDAKASKLLYLKYSSILLIPTTQYLMLNRIQLSFTLCNFLSQYWKFNFNTTTGITGQYGATFSHKISPWSCMVLELYLIAKHNTSIYPGSDGEIGLGDYGPSVTRYLGRVRWGGGSGARMVKL